MKIRKGDIIVIVGLIFLSFGLNFAVTKMATGYKGDMLVVEQDGKVIKKLPMDEDTEYKVDYGGHYNIIVIKDGKAYMKEADCQDQICTNMHPIEKEGQTIICLPHRLFLEMESHGDKKDNKDTIDKVVQ
ncbi:NusG domain II-containing protein [uncultured Anaerococcus sp.]|uniref:NusG domain II-containing protein n=1 Tax=uncultured Anaerococcus sp. TaxID=293428 RepID=UPI0026374ED2|nr:NusG domain II-containing protein [uncultured Anaerococcus sp.]